MMFTRCIFNIKTVGKFIIPKGMLNGSSLYFYSVRSHLHPEERELISIQIGTQLGRAVVLTVKRP